MKKLLQINPVLRRNTSTGKIMQEIGELAMKNGWESYIAYSRGRDGYSPDSCKSHLIPVGSKLSVALHGVETRLFDRHGLGSVAATRKFIAEIEKIDPDIIHIHNIHGYFLNYKILFDYLAKSGRKVIWTIHDCWLFTGHCYYYTAAGCNKWQESCGNCPQRTAFPKSIFLDRSAKNLKDKSRAFNSLKTENFVIAPVSEWMKNEMSHSFLAGKNFQVIHNGIDTETFKPVDDATVRVKYGLGNKHILLGLASIWLREKGFDDFVRLASGLNDDEVLVMVGRMTDEQKARLPKSIVTINRTENMTELAELYSAASAFINPTWQDNYPTVNLEAISCGTPVITYRTGGSVESICEKTGFIVEQGDTAGILDCFRIIRSKGKEHYTQPCRDYALEHFRKEDRYADYLELYEKLRERR